MITDKMIAELKAEMLAELNAECKQQKEVGLLLNEVGVLLKALSGDGISNKAEYRIVLRGIKLAIAACESYDRQNGEKE